MSEPFGTAEGLDLEAIERRVHIVKGTEYDRSTWTGGMLDFMTRTEVPALIAENAALRKQVGELCPIGDLDTITSLRAEIQMLQEQVARYKPLYDAVHGMRRGMVLLHRSESDRWAVFQIGYPPVNGDTPEAALGLEEGEDE